jgi:hypothetical protein
LEIDALKFEVLIETTGGQLQTRADTCAISSRLGRRSAQIWSKELREKFAEVAADVKFHLKALLVRQRTNLDQEGLLISYRFPE